MRLALRISRGVLLVPLFLAGCTFLIPLPNVYRDAPTDPWAAVPAALQTSNAAVIYATDRLREPEQSPLKYGFKRSLGLEFGVCTVNFGNGLSYEELKEKSAQTLRVAPVPVSIAGCEAVGKYPDTPWLERVGDTWQWVGKNEERQRLENEKLHALVGEKLALTPRKEAFVYIHGFNNDFDLAAMVIAQLWHYCGREGVPIVYTWPAGTSLSLRAYNYDRESGEFTNFHLKSFIEALAKTPGLERIHLIAHSRGTDVLITALRELHIKYTAAAKGDYTATARELRLGNVILAAPDIDLDVALQRLAAERVDRACRRLTIYSSPEDVALGLVRWLFDSVVRVGTLGTLELPDGVPDLAAVPGIDLIHTRVVSDFIGHAYFYTNPAACSDVIMLLRYDRSPGEKNGRPLIPRNDQFWELREDYKPEYQTETPSTRRQSLGIESDTGRFGFSAAR